MDKFKPIKAARVLFTKKEFDALLSEEIKLIEEKLVRIDMYHAIHLHNLPQKNEYLLDY
ncbi:hypothetical protein BRE01_54260 [Brevibacillus reuszeri]|uniref:Uncharacterized protein n=1 Tax=Brevibacillus reuszeri TaxID=54915 RepID=A0ABQ0TVR8_9BACL|nr:hypothetical protein BRE01_54260 [Brevibacillus reuszeri]